MLRLGTLDSGTLGPGSCLPSASTLNLSYVYLVLLSPSMLCVQLVSLGIIHADLKPENALLQMCAMGGPLLTVADYGLSIVMPQGQQSVPHT